MKVMNPISSDRSRDGFTLIELLVVIVIVGLLAGLAVPAILNGLERAIQVKCTNNLRQIGAAMQLYVADNNGNYPFWGGAGDSDNPAWHIALSQSGDYGLSPYEGPAWRFDEVFYCPHSGRDGTGGWPAHNPDYGINLEVINHEGTPTKAIQVINPSSTALMVETKGSESILAGDFRFNPFWGGLMNNGPTADGTSLQKGSMVFRHPKPTSESDMSRSSCNVLFCDGHVETVRFHDPRLQDRAGRDALFEPNVE